MNKAVILIILAALALPTFSCSESNDDVGETTGTITGKVRFSGEWPETGTMMIAAFAVAPWNPDFDPAPPAGVYFFEKPTSMPVDLSYSIEHLKFQKYEALAIAWTDEEEDNSACRDHALGVVGVDQSEIGEAGRSDPTGEAVLNVLSGASAFELATTDPVVEVPELTEIKILNVTMIRLMIASVGKMTGYDCQY